MKQKLTGLKGFVCANIIFVLAAMILSILSSQMAYAVTNIRTVIVCTVGVMLLEVIGIIIKNKLKGTIVIDTMFLLAIFLTAYALCQMIMGRLNLMGYVWFSDLESGNPVAVGALNLAVASWVCYLLALMINIVIGFRKQ